MYNYEKFKETYLKEHPDLPYLISYPRTGSHWLRMIMESYLKIPCLSRGFLVDRTSSFWATHGHDKEVQLNLPKGPVIYLYRNPVDVVYSELIYDFGSAEDHVESYAFTYKRHLIKWLGLAEKYPKKIHSLTYEDLKRNACQEIGLLLGFLKYHIDDDLIKESIKGITKSRVNSSTVHDPKVINNSNTYQENKRIFKERNIDLFQQGFVELRL